MSTPGITSTCAQAYEANPMSAIIADATDEQTGFGGDERDIRQLLHQTLEADARAAVERLTATKSWRSSAATTSTPTSPPTCSSSTRPSDSKSRLNRVTLDPGGHAKSGHRFRQQRAPAPALAARGHG